MSNKSSMTFQIKADNTDKVGQELEEAIKRALEICGGKAETYAKQDCPVDTGLLRNSITHAVGGKGAAIAGYKANRPDTSGVTREGSYGGTIGKEGDHTVYIGSNVEYAVYNELHHKFKSGFLRKAVENHLSEYKNIIESELKK